MEGNVTMVYQQTTSAKRTNQINSLILKGHYDT